MIEIILHCADTDNFQPVSAKVCHKWHTQKGWDGIGYHKWIDTNGTVENGRPDYWTGAHCIGHNDSIGICLAGRTEFTDRQLRSLYSLLQSYQDEYGNIVVRGHREYDPNKDCPGDFLMQWIKDHGFHKPL